MKQSPDFSTDGNVHGRILVGIDFSRPGRHALIRARALARDGGGRLMAFHVIDGHGLEEIARLVEMPLEEVKDRLWRERRHQLAELLVEIDAEEGEAPAMEAVVAWGVPFEEIVRKAADVSSSLIVLGTMGRSADLQRALFGSTAEKVLRSAPCPVLCVPTE